MTLFLKSKTTGKKTGTQSNKRKRVEDDIENISTVLSDVFLDEEEYVVLSNGGLLRKEWKDILLFFSASKAPPSWVENFNKNSDASHSLVKQADAQFSKF